MANTVIVGAQWGDEGKGKIVDALAARVDVVVRYQGGSNAGHTVVVGGEKVILHQLPSGILRPRTVCMIGNGVVIDPLVLSAELDEVKRRGAMADDAQLLISSNAHVIMPWHRLLDELRERASGGRAIGTTGRGIGPAYEDKVGRRGVRVRDLLKPDALAQRVHDRLPSANRELRALSEELAIPSPELSAPEIIGEYSALGARLAGYAGDVSLALSLALRQGRRVLFEGAQGALLDIDHGTYPYVTSSNCVAGNAAVGSGVGPTAIDSVLGVTKAYTTRVGAGPFPTELEGEAGERLRRAGNEFGSTTGRPRRCGWLDLVALRYAIRVNGISTLALTKMDVLTGLPVVRVAVAYEISGRRVEELPGDLEELEAAVPIYEDLPGWSEGLGGARSASDLPAAANAFLKLLEELAGVPVCCLSTGPGREELLMLREP